MSSLMTDFPRPAGFLRGPAGSPGKPRRGRSAGKVASGGSPALHWGKVFENPCAVRRFAPSVRKLRQRTHSEQTDPSGMIYMQGRFQLPVWGRFASPDPAMDQHPEQPQSWNLYSYVQNNPVMKTDPTGMFSWEELKNNVKSWFKDFDKDFKANAMKSAQATQALYNKPYQVKSVAAANKIMGGDLKGGVKQLGGAWASAGKDPGWVAGAALATATAVLGGGGGSTASNPVPGTLARVIPGEGPFSTLGPPTSADVFVTNPAAIEGLTSSQISQRLTIPQSDVFTVIKFPTPAEGLASPVFRFNPGFLGGGRTAGGAPEFVVPNGPIPSEATTTLIGPGE